MFLPGYKLVSTAVRTSAVNPTPMVAVFFYVTGVGLKCKFFTPTDPRFMEFVPFFEGREFVVPRSIETDRDLCDAQTARLAYDHAVELVKQEQEEKRRIEEVVLQMKKEGKI